MNKKLTLAFKCQSHTKEFFKLVCNLFNIPHDSIPLTAIKCVEEMSKICHPPAKALIQITEMDPQSANVTKSNWRPILFQESGTASVRTTNQCQWPHEEEDLFNQKLLMSHNLRINIRLQFLDIRMQKLQDKLNLLHTQIDYIVKEHKDLWQMTAQEIDYVIKDLAKQQKQVEEIQHKYDTLNVETPDTDENAQQRSHYQYSMR